MSQARRPDVPDAAGAAPARGTPAAGRGRLLVAGLVLAALLLAVKTAAGQPPGCSTSSPGCATPASRGMAVFVVAYVLACVLFLPGVVLTLGAGFAYGVAVGVPLVWVSANLGRRARLPARAARLRARRSRRRVEREPALRRHRSRRRARGAARSSC